MIKTFAKSPQWRDDIPGFEMAPCKIFAGDRDAYELVLMLIRVSNIWDDQIDKDVEVSRDEINYSYKSIYVDMLGNAFFLKHMPALSPLLTNSILSYFTANHYEETQDAHGIELGHVLRYGLVQTIGHIIYLVGGFEHAKMIWPRLYKTLCPDRFADYKKEVSHAEQSV